MVRRCFPVAKTAGSSPVVITWVYCMHFVTLLQVRYYVWKWDSCCQLCSLWFCAWHFRLIPISVVGAHQFLYDISFQVSFDLSVFDHVASLCASGCALPWALVARRHSRFDWSVGRLNLGVTHRSISMCSTCIIIEVVTTEYRSWCYYEIAVDKEKLRWINLHVMMSLEARDPRITFWRRREWSPL